QITLYKNLLILSFSFIAGNVFVYGKLRVCGRGFSEGKSEAGKRATNLVPAKTSNFLYTVFYAVFSFILISFCLYSSSVKIPFAFKFSNSATNLLYSLFLISDDFFSI